MRTLLTLCVPSAYKAAFSVLDPYVRHPFPSYFHHKYTLSLLSSQGHSLPEFCLHKKKKKIIKAAKLKLHRTYKSLVSTRNLIYFYYKTERLRVGRPDSNPYLDLHQVRGN